MSTSNCGENKPLITLGSGEAPTLDYSLPQKACFASLGRIRLNIPREWFLDKWSVDPKENYWTSPIKTVEAANSVLARDFSNALNSRTVSSKTAKPVNTTSARTRTNQPAAPSSIMAPDIKAESAASLMVEGYRPVEWQTLGGAVDIKFIPKPVKAMPRLYLIEEYVTCSYLANYGAGKTLNTFSLLPGEKTTISIRTYRDSEDTRSTSENILDSFSQTSADELEKLIEQESGFSASTSSSQSGTTTGNAGIGVGADLFGLVSVDLNGGVESSTTKSAETQQEEHFDSLDRSLSKHVEQSSYTREIEINSTTSSTVTEGEEQAITRELSNLNHSRVLNFVFRQLLQEYLTVSYLNNVRVAFSNGFPETIEAIEMYALDEVLPKYIKSEFVSQAKALILGPYCTIFNYKQQPKQFIERVERTYLNCVSPGQPASKKVFFRKEAQLADEYEGIQVHGIIKRVQRNILRTPAVIVEALLGQGEALDCYNQELQNATVERAKLDNEIKRQGLAIVSGMPSAQTKAEAHARIFVPLECCDQSKDENRAS